MTDKQQRLEEALKRLVGDGEVRGAVLVSRDGFCVLNQFNRLPSPETFSAMSATLVGAAEAALSELGVRHATRVVVSTETDRLVTVGATDELLLVALLDGDAALEASLGRIDEAARSVAKIVGG